jgi:hypothetical protein
MLLLIKLILAHLIGDFLLQPTSWIKNKERRKITSSKLYLHVLIHGGLVMILLWDLSTWPIVVLIAVAHWAIDLIKLYAQKPKTSTKWFIGDQLLHLLSIVLIWLLFTEVVLGWKILFQDPKILATITLVLFLTQPTSIILANVFKKWSEDIPSQSDQSLQNAGKYIGILERLFVFVFIVTNHWEAVGFLIAAKSVFRFGDLRKSKERKLTEYILIGTLLSFGIALVCGFIFLMIAS